MTDTKTVSLTFSSLKADPWPVLHDLRRRGSVVRAKLPFIGKVWIATSAHAVALVLKDNDRFVMDPANAGKKFVAGIKWWMPGSIRLLADNMLLKDDPDHRRLRKLVDQAFQRQDVNAMRDRIQSIATELLDPHSHAHQMDIAQDFARVFPLYVIADILGLPESDRPYFRSLAGDIVKTPSLLTFVRAIPKIGKLQRYLTKQFDACRSNPRPGLLSAMVEAHDGDGALSDSELLSMSFLLLMAGHETTSHLISVGMLTLLQHPEQKQSLMDDWSRVALATEEILRYAAPVQFSKPRHVRHDMTFEGVEMRRGEYVMACLAAANLDPAHADDPDTFDIGRKPNPHFTFGTGSHYCLGLLLARAEAQIAFQELLTRFPEMRLAVAPDKLTWAGGGIRGLESLPVRLS